MRCLQCDCEVDFGNQFCDGACEKSYYDDIRAEKESAEDRYEMQVERIAPEGEEQ